MRWDLTKHKFRKDMTHYNNYQYKKIHDESYFNGVDDMDVSNASGSSSLTAQIASLNDTLQKLSDEKTKLNGTIATLDAKIAQVAGRTCRKSGGGTNRGYVDANGTYWCGDDSERGNASARQTISDSQKRVSAIDSQMKQISNQISSLESSLSTAAKSDPEVIKELKERDVIMAKAEVDKISAETKKKIILITVGVLALGAIAFIAIKVMKARKGK